MIVLENVHKAFGNEVAIHAVSLHIPEGAIYGIMGPSGAGKSTILRMMNLLEKPDSGHVMVGGRQLTTATSLQLNAARKSIGMIFQHFHLVANKTVYDNIAVALSLADVPKKEHATRVAEVLAYVGLEAHAKKYPAMLSGGQKQRVAIARALVTKPQVLLCDEPTSALDSNTTSGILQVLAQIHRDFGMTIVLVSHEVAVIKSICTHVAILEQGEIYKILDITPTGITASDNTAESFVRALQEDHV